MCSCLFLPTFGPSQHHDVTLATRTGSIGTIRGRVFLLPIQNRTDILDHICDCSYRPVSGNSLCPLFCHLTPKYLFYLFLHLYSLDTFLSSSSSLPVRVFTSILLLVVIRLLYPLVNFRCLSYYMLCNSKQYLHFGKYTLKILAGVSSTLLQISIFLYALCSDEFSHLYCYAHSVSTVISSGHIIYFAI